MTESTQGAAPAELSHWKSRLDLAATVLIVLTCLLVSWKIWATGLVPPPSRAAAASVPAEPISVAGAPSKGRREAPVVIVLFSEFQCPYCGQFSRETLPLLITDYIDTGRASLVFKHLPIPSHRDARGAAVAAACADSQGQFWPLHDAFFANPGSLDSAAIAQQAESVGLDRNAFSRCTTTDSAQAVRVVDANIREAAQLKVTGTPTFFFGHWQADGTVKAVQRMSGAQPYVRFKEILDGLK